MIGHDIKGMHPGQNGSARTIFLIALVCATLFIWTTSLELPEVAASHFAGSGTANGFMPRDAYVAVMLGFVLVLPSLLVFVPTIRLDRPQASIRLPNKAYWLAPARQAETLEYLRQHMARYGILLLVLLCYVHWLVVQANRSVPPNMSAPWAIGGICVFILASLLWAAALTRHFRRIPG